MSALDVIEDIFRNAAELHNVNLDWTEGTELTVIAKDADTIHSFITALQENKILIKKWTPSAHEGYEVSFQHPYGEYSNLPCADLDEDMVSHLMDYSSTLLPLIAAFYKD